jgi:hypothetical protein
VEPVSPRRAVLAGCVVVLVCLVVFCLVYFGTSKVTERNYMRIANGMSYAEVIEILGQPEDEWDNPDSGPGPNEELWVGHDEGGTFRCIISFDGPRGRVIGKRMW